MGGYLRVDIGEDKKGVDMGADLREGIEGKI